MKKGLFDEERIDDLEDVSLEELLEEKEKEEALASKHVDTKETLKKISNTTLNVSKKVLDKVQDEEFQEGVSYYSFKFLIWISQILAAPLGMLAYIFYLTLVTKNDERMQDGKSMLGAHLIYIAIPSILIWLTLFKATYIFIFLLLVIWIEYFILMLEYSNSWSKRYSKKLGITNPFAIYFNNPLHTAELDNDLETKIFGDSRGKNETGSVHTADTFFNEAGYVRKINILKSNDLTIHADKLSDDFITKYGILPQAIEGDVYYVKDGWIYQSIDYVLGTLSRDGLIQMIKENDAINFGFEEVAEQLEKQREDEAIRLQAEQQALEEAKLYNAFEEKGLNDKAIKIIMKLKKSQELFGISVHDLFGRSMEFTKNYLKVRVDLMENTTRKNLEANADRIAQKIGILPRIERAENESSAYLTFVLNTKIKGKKLTAAEIRKDAENSELNLGQTIFGDYIIQYNQKDEEDNLEIAGLQGSGKSYATMYNLYSRMYLKNQEFDKYMYDEITIASTKPADYLKLGWDKVGVTILDNPVDTFKYLINLHREGMRRKNLFTQERVGSFYEYNKSHKNTDEDYLARKLFVFDEVQNMLSQAKKILINLGGKKVKLSDAIIDLHIMIVKEHRSQGIGTFLVPQTFDAKSLGEIGDVYTNKMLGRAKESTWNYYDSTQSITKYLKYSTENQGLFFKTGSGLPLKKGLKEERLGDWVKLNLNYFDFDDIAKNSTRIFDNTQLKEDIENTNIDILENGLSMFDLDNQEDNADSTTYQSELSDDDI